MRNRSRALAVLMAAVFLFPFTASAKSYLYTGSGKAAPAPAVYTIKKQIELKIDGVTAEMPQDLFQAASGEIYIADTNHNRILILNSSYEPIRAISEFTSSSGAAETLSAPEGIYVSPAGELYIADTQNHRIIKCDKDGNIKLVIEKPEGLTGVGADAAFNPVKLSVDSSGRIYVVARNYNLGILQLDASGNFVGYIGAPKVQYNLAQMIWRKISTEEQLSQMEQYVPTEYNNIAIDQEDFLYGTIGTLDKEAVKSVIASQDTSGTVTPVKKLNTAGSDVLKRNGSYPPIGDLLYDTDPSKIVDAAYTDNGIYALLDAAAGHIFLYDENGNLLGVFGGYGSRQNDFRQVSSLSFAGSDIVVLDAAAARVSVFALTAYGEKLIAAAAAQFQGDFEISYQLWSEIAAQNRNFEYAFVGLGQSYFSDGNYKKAMDCFRLANDKKNYSRAKSLLRKQKMKTVFPAVFVLLLCMVLFLFVYRLARRVYRYVKGYPDHQ